jgi:hypothetical protein
VYEKRTAVSDVRRFLVALARLWRARAKIVHVPTLRQVRWMVGFDGRDPRSYLLDRSVNWLPATMPESMEKQLGRHGLLLTRHDPFAPHGSFELVVFPDGWGFDLT